ncbi:hypothetical protein RA19_05685 [Leisingera sp. ANG-M1]|uniref:hypothetical protein n=1 Tax=Leisingera sp. ANG-M1 TaxID=1577895 RepID=UPI00057F6883|nr:hypothetical protein [Leisingera sp. ANG-M1]KIC11531.1 hypothetical protein RA19_05685 [Leisingera sp. ANG-M1]
MPFSLLKLSSGFFSLEFETSDLPHVREVIEAAFGHPKITQHAISSAIEIAGCKLTFQNEWDDPCLISGSDEGNQVLTKLFSLLTAKDS